MMRLEDTSGEKEILRDRERGGGWEMGETDRRTETGAERSWAYAVALWWGQATGKENGGGGRQRTDAMEVNEEMVQKSMVRGMESCRNTKENED